MRTQPGRINPFTATHEELSEFFSARGISTEENGFCDSPEFLEAERSDPAILNFYAAYVAKRPYCSSYVENARQVITKAAELLHKELVDNGRLGACVDISGILSRMLDREGVWNCCVKGSLTVRFPKTSYLEPRYFWSLDDGAFTAAHAWLFAAPFTVVDISVAEQPYEKRERAFLPPMVISEDRTPVPIELEDVMSPSYRARAREMGISPAELLSKMADSIPELFAAIPPIETRGYRKAVLKYVPVAIHAPDCCLEDMRNMTFGGMTPGELYERKISPLLRSFLEGAREGGASSSS